MTKREEFFEAINKYGVVSYSSYDSKTNPYPEHNVLMWSHYGDSHKGICLVFKVDKVPNRLRKVIYQDTIPEVEYVEKTNALEILLTKSPGWEYEGEYREFNKDGDRPVKYIGKLTEVIFGCRTPIADMNQILHICDNIHDDEITYSRMYMTDGSLQLTKETWSSHKKGSKFTKHVESKSEYDFSGNAHLK